MRMDEHNDTVIYNEQNAKKLSEPLPHKTKTHRTETRKWYKELKKWCRCLETVASCIGKTKKWQVSSTIRENSRTLAAWIESISNCCLISFAYMICMLVYKFHMRTSSTPAVQQLLKFPWKIMAFICFSCTSLCFSCSNLHNDIVWVFCLNM